MSSQLKSTIASTGIVRVLSVLLVVMLVASAGFSGGALAHDGSSGTAVGSGHQHGPDKGASGHDHGQRQGHNKGPSGHDHDNDDRNSIDQRQTNTQRNQAIINYGIQLNVNRQEQRAGGNAVGSQYQQSSQTNLAGINYGIQLNLNVQRQFAASSASVDQTQISQQVNLAGINYGLQQNVNIQEQRATLTQDGEQVQGASDHDHGQSQGHDKGPSGHDHEKHDQGNKGAPDQDGSVDQTQTVTQLNAAIVNYGTQENINDQTQGASVNQYSGAMYNASGGNEIDASGEMMTLLRGVMSNTSISQLAS
jgi:hypothetical protein